MLFLKLLSEVQQLLACTFAGLIIIKCGDRRSQDFEGVIDDRVVSNTENIHQKRPRGYFLHTT